MFSCVGKKRFQAVTQQFIFPCLGKKRVWFGFFFSFPRGRSVYMEASPVSDVSMCGYAVFICGAFFNLKR